MKRAQVRLVLPALLATALAACGGSGGGSSVAAVGSGSATAQGQLALLAGSANFSRTADGSGIAVDAQGNVYVADTGNARIREISPQGVVTTVRRASVAGTATPFTLPLQQPCGVAVDGSGDIFVADCGSGKLYKSTSAGVGSTLVSQGALGALAVDSSGTVYFSVAYGVEKITAAGAMSLLTGIAVDGAVLPAGTVASGDLDGPRATASFGQITSLAVDGSDNLYLIDQTNAALREISAAGTVSTLLPASSGLSGVAVSSQGTVYVANATWGTVSTVSGGSATVLAGGGERAGTAQFGYIGAIALNPFTAQVDVADVSSASVSQVTLDGVVSAVPNGTLLPTVPLQPIGITAASDGNLFVSAPYQSGSSPYCIQEIVPGVSNGCSANPVSVTGTGALTIDANGNLYLANDPLETISELSAAGSLTTVAGGSNGLGQAVPIGQPSGIARDARGNLYVADAEENDILMIMPSGLVAVLAGQAGSSGSADGQGSAARFRQPGAVALDSRNNLYVVDQGNDTIRKITPSGVVSTVVGTPGVTRFQAGSLPGSLNPPTGLVVLPGDAGLVISMVASLSNANPGAGLAIVRF